MNSSTRFCFGVATLAAAACLAVGPRSSRAAEAETVAQPTNAAAAAETPSSGPTNGVISSNVVVSTNAYLELRAAQEAIEQLRRELEASAARNAEAITAGLGLIEPTLARMHERQMEAVQSSNRTILMVAGVFAAVGFLGLIFISLILVRALGRFSEMAVVAGPRPILGASQPLQALGDGDSGSAVDRATGRFQGAIHQLQERIQELERSLQTPADHAPAPAPAISASRPAARLEATAASVSNIQPLPPAPPVVAASAGASVAGSEASRTSVLLGKGQALLNLDSAEQALQCFEQALMLEPNNPDALVKKGLALEKLQDWEQALQNYDRAIAIDDSLTVAYLYRGGVCNRLQRYREALESYEQALRTEKKSRAS